MYFAFIDLMCSLRIWCKVMKIGQDKADRLSYDVMRISCGKLFIETAAS